MSRRLFSRTARTELRDAVLWLHQRNPGAAVELLDTAMEAARLIADNPVIGRIEPELAPARYRFWSIPAFRYLLVYETDPEFILRVVHTSRDLPAVLADLT